MDKIRQAGVGFRSLTEAIDTTSPGGRMMMQIVGVFAEFERTMLRERPQNGLEAARKDGRLGGRRSKLKAHQQQEVVTLVNSGMKSAADAARLFNVHPATVSRLLLRSKAITPSPATTDLDRAIAGGPKSASSSTIELVIQ